MKLAIVIPGFQSSPDDWCIPAFTNLARELSQDAEVHVFALRYPHRRDTYRIGEVHVHTLGGGAVGGRRYPGLSLLNLWRLARREVEREHQRGRFSSIVGVWATESGWLATRIGKRLRVRTLVHLAGGELTRLPSIGYGNWGRGLPGWMVKQTLQKADMLTVPSGAVARQLLERAPHAVQKAMRWPLGVDTNMFAPLANSTQSPQSKGQLFTFVAVGSLIPVKGYGLLLDSFARFMRGLNVGEREGVRLKIVGAGPMFGALQEQVGNLDLYSHLQGYVAFEGEIPHDRLPQVYREADCYVCTSWHEAECMAALEAMACGLPWIGPPVGALGDVAQVEEYPVGVCVATRSTAAFAEGMSRVFSMPPGERARLVENARRIVLKEYDLKAQTARLLALSSPSKPSG